MAMNVFRLCGDMLNVMSHILLVTRLLLAKNAQGISLATLELYLVVYMTRYLDVFTSFYSFYNSCMKIFYVTITAASIILIRCYGPLRTNRDIDKVPYWRFCFLPCFIMTTIIACSDDIKAILGNNHYYLGWLEFCWTFSILMESITMIPQLVLLEEYQEVECLSGCYMAFKGFYRLFYIFNWIFRAYHEPYYRHHILVYFCGVVQALWGLCILVVLRRQGWRPLDIFVGATYTQPRLSRRKEETIDDATKEEEKLDAKQDSSIRRPAVRENRSIGEGVVKDSDTPGTGGLSEPLLTQVV